LYLFNDSVRNQYFDPRDKRAILKSWHSDGVNIAQIVGLYWTHMIAKATTQGEAE
jgi:hypothetical protein